MVKNRTSNMMDQEQFCPLCMEEFDLTDKSFHPCRCGYQVCIWCFHNIQDKLNGLCPACRTPYDKSSLNRLDPNLLAAAEADRKRKKEQQRVEKAIAKAAAAAPDHKDVRSDRSALQNVRVMQRNLVYVTGLSPTIAKEETLRRKEHFGRFGRIVKVAVNKKTSTSTYSAYVTFKRNADASDCISHLNSLSQEGKSSMRATFGTTKYCSFFLRHIQCNNPGCLYLHELANESECFTKEDLQHDFQMDEFDMDVHCSQTSHSADVPHASNSTTTASGDASPPKVDHSTVNRATTPQSVETSTIPGNFVPRSSSASQPAKEPIQPVSNDSGAFLSRAHSVRSSVSTKGVEVKFQPYSSAFCDASHSVASSAFPAQSSFLDYSEPRLRIPRPPSQSRRSFALKDDDHADTQMILPGISALGLGKTDSGPFGWDSQRNSEPRGVPKATISPPDSPRTQQRVEQQKIFRQLLPNVDVAFIPHQNPRAQDLFPAPAMNSRQSLHQFTGQPPLIIDKTPVGPEIGPPPGSEHRQRFWSHTLPTTPSYPAHYDGYPRDRAPRPPPPGLTTTQQSMTMPSRFDHHSPPPGMAPVYDQPALGIIPLRMNHRPQSPAGFVHPPSDSDDFRISSQRYPPNVSQNKTPGLIQRPSMEPVLHINGAWFM